VSEYMMMSEPCSSGFWNTGPRKVLSTATGGRAPPCWVASQSDASRHNARSTRLLDLALWREASDWLATQQGGARPPVAVDNTFLGPVFQKPLEHGSDIIMYSL